MQKCFITGNSLKENEASHQFNEKGLLRMVKITNSQDGLKYTLSDAEWANFCKGHKGVPYFEKDEIRRIRVFVFKKNKNGKVPDISNIHIDLKNNNIPAVPNMYDRAMCLLRYFVEETKELGVSVPFDYSSMVSASYSLSDNEVKYLLEYLKNVKYISYQGMSGHKVEPEGFEKAEKLKETSIDSEEVFIIMPLKTSLDELSNSIKKTVENCGLTPKRIDENLNNKKIDDEIIVFINRSLFVICDLTPPDGGNQNGNVYFEAGYAKGRKIEIIWTCKKEHIENLPFDIRQYRCIGWDKDKLSEFEKKLKDTILSILGDISK